jgi:alpha-L-fucosidase
VTTWFDGAGLGMFVHWSHCSLAGRELSWPLVGGVGALPGSATATVDEYHATADRFGPEPGAPARWCELAREAGMRYAVLTTRHHDGFSLWPTQHADWSIARTDYGGDLVGEFIDAARAAGLRVGLYYSLSDWHHPDYPAFTDADRPYAFIGYRRPSPEAWERYLTYLFGQVRELLTNYGPVDLLWFDGGWERTADEWRSAELLELIKSLQPGCLVNDRLPGFGDFETPEQFVPALPPSGPWETCMTMNGSWGWCPDDARYKSARELVHTLCEVAGRGGNLLLNVGPRADGSLPTEQVERLEVIAEWMGRHRSAIHDTGAGLDAWQFYGPTTKAHGRVHLLLLARPYESVTVRGIRVRRVKAVRDLATGRELAFRERIPVLDEIVRTPDPVGELIVDVPEDVLDPLATVLEIELADG